MHDKWSHPTKDQCDKQMERDAVTKSKIWLVQEKLTVVIMHAVYSCSFILCPNVIHSNTTVTQFPITSGLLYYMENITLWQTLDQVIKSGKKIN